MASAIEHASMVAAAAGGDRRALARLITLVEDRRAESGEALRLSFATARPAHRIGVTGAPGAGKSTITDRLIAIGRERGETIGVLAVDPTSPFSGGAVLGDRVRMQEHALDEGVFIRSMASRGHLGGLSEAAPKALTVMEIAGFTQLLVETVGVGQDEVEVASATDTVVVVLTPGWGDGIQAAKAGILEIGDVFVVNKADRSGVAETVADIRAMLELGDKTDWEPPILETVAVAGKGVATLWEAVGQHAAHLGKEGLEAGRRRRRLAELEVGLAAEYRQRAQDVLDSAGESAVVAAVAEGTVDPWSAARELAGT